METCLPQYDSIDITKENHAVTAYTGRVYTITAIEPPTYFELPEEEVPDVPPLVEPVDPLLLLEDPDEPLVPEEPLLPLIPEAPVPPLDDASLERRSQPANIALSTATASIDLETFDIVFIVVFPFLKK
jgi:hypothetical protein